MSSVIPGLELYLGNVRWLNLRIRRYGQREAYSVSNAQKIAVEFAREGEAPLNPIFASRTDPGADWIAGIVPVLVSPADLTARIGSYDVSVTIFDTPVELTASLGRVEVLPRPIAGQLTLPGGGSYAATQVLSARNAGAYTIPAGAPVGSTSSGVVLALAGLGPIPADGIAISAAAPGSTCLYIASGQVRLDDWSVVFGSASLPIGATELWLGATQGTITDVEPELPTYVLRQVVGDVANDGQTLNVNVSSGFML